MSEMIDMSRFVEAKSDQLNADDLIGISKTVTITRVAGSDGDQPISIFYHGDNGKPFKPCKTMRRVLMAVWGRYANEYVGRSMTLYRDDKVTFGGLETGGIRISHMSDIERETVVVVMKSKGKKAGLKILPLVSTKEREGITEAAVRGWLSAATTLDELGNVWARRDVAPFRKVLETFKDERKALLSRGPDPEGPADEQRGEAHATVDVEAEILAHLARKVTVVDVNSLVSSRRGELDEGGQARLAEAAMERIAEIKGAAE